MENDFCNRCGCCCRNIIVDFSDRVLYWDGKVSLRDDFASMLSVVFQKENISICKCKYLKNNLCTNPQKPEECKNYPSFPFVKLSQDCGYEGKIFLEQEKIKQKIRKLKEEIIHYQAMIEMGSNKFEKNQLEKIIAIHQKRIDKYSQFGSEDW